MRHESNSCRRIAASIIGVSFTLIPVAVSAEMRSRDCGNIKLEDKQATDNSLFYLDDNQWKKLRKDEALSDRRSAVLAFVANDGRELDGGMVLVKSVDFYKGKDVRDKSVRLFRDEYKTIKGKKKSEFKGFVDIDHYQNAHLVDGKGDDLGSLRKFHARNYVLKGNTTSSTDSSAQKKKNFIFEERQIEASESLLSWLFSPKTASAAKKDAATLSRSSDSEKISIDQFSAKLKYYTHNPSDMFDVVCFSIKPKDDVIKTKISIRDFEYDGPERDADPIGRSANWIIRWTDPS